MSGNVKLDHAFIEFDEEVKCGFSKLFCDHQKEKGEMVC